MRIKNRYSSPLEKEFVNRRSVRLSLVIVITPSLSYSPSYFTYHLLESSSSFRDDSDPLVMLVLVHLCKDTNSDGTDGQ